jgi:carbonic anhydrase
MKCLFALLLAGACGAALAGDHPQPAGLSPERVLERLMAGNRRFVAHKEVHPDVSVTHRKNLAAAGQHPFAVILGCADSRVPPEIIFDQGLGDLFVVRDAGNLIAGDEVLGSIEYAVEHLNVHLVMVLGHEKCGAVTAALEAGESHGHIAALVNAIRPSVEEAKSKPGDKVHNCVVANVLRVAKQLRESEPVLKEFVAAGKVKVVAADYDVSSGKVTLLK